MKYLLPSDFNRRSRSLCYWKLWKATEFRHFLLYFGPVILKDCLPGNIFNHFLLLHVSISILSNKVLTKDTDNIDKAETLLLIFVMDFQNIYGEENVAFNVHNLIHLAKDVKKYGPIESFSAFPFESYLCSIKKLIRCSYKPLQQVARRLAEYESLVQIKSYIGSLNNNMIFGKEHFSGILSNNHIFHQQYKSLTINSWTIQIDDERNSYVMLKDRTIVHVLNIGKSNQMYLIGKRCTVKKDLYTVSSFHSNNLLNISVVKEHDTIEDWPCSHIYSKMFKMQGSQNFAIFPIIHTILCD